MYARIFTAARPAFNATLVSVEADVLHGLPNLSIVGLPDHALRESRDRIRAAIVNAGFHFPARHIVINLSPNDIPKEGGLLEAAMAAAILVATGQLPAEPFHDTALLGALSLSGEITVARGLAAAAIFAAGQKKIRRIIVPQIDTGLVTVPEEISLFTLRSIAELPLFCHGGINAAESGRYTPQLPEVDLPIEHIFGLSAAKRALAIAAVGGHHVILAGTPGTGKSLLARAYRHLLPAPEFAEAAEITRVYSLAGLGSGELMAERPFRSPHHTTSTPALVGGSTLIRPGEISLAHKGVLFLDELPEFRNEALQSLREPLEEKRITIARARGAITYPADFQLIAAANPCRCGNLFIDGGRCSCRKGTGLDQFAKLIGPFLDRIAIELNLNELPSWPLDEEEYTTARLQARIAERRAASRERNGGLLNNSLEAAMLYRRLSHMNPQRLYERYAPQQRLSMRSWLNVLRVAQSIADFEDSEVTELNVHEALSYRFIQRKLASLKAA